VRVVARDPYRKSLQIENRSPVTTCYIDNVAPGGLSTTNASIRVFPNETVQITEFEDGNLVHDEWSIIAEAAGTEIAYCEGSLTGGP